MKIEYIVSKDKNALWKEVVITTCRKISGNVCAYVYYLLQLGLKPSTIFDYISACTVGFRLHFNMLSIFIQSESTRSTI